MTTIVLFITVAGIGLQVLAVRGGAFHNLLVRRTAAAFEGVGFRVRVEHPLRLPDGRTDFVDLLADRDGIAIACEVETTPRYVAVNAEHAGRLGLPLWIVVPTRTVARAVARRLAARLAWPAAGRNWILLPDEVGQRLTTLFGIVFPSESHAKGKQK